MPGTQPTTNFPARFQALSGPVLNDFIRSENLLEISRIQLAELAACSSVPGQTEGKQSLNCSAALECSNSTHDIVTAENRQTKGNWLSEINHPIVTDPFIFSGAAERVAKTQDSTQELIISSHCPWVSPRCPSVGQGPHRHEAAASGSEPAVWSQKYRLAAPSAGTWRPATTGDHNAARHKKGDVMYCTKRQFWPTTMGDWIRSRKTVTM